MPAPTLTITQTPGPFVVAPVDLSGFRYTGTMSQANPTANWTFTLSLLVQTPASIPDPNDRVPILQGAAYTFPFNEYPSLAAVTVKIQQIYDRLADDLIAEFGP